MAQMNLDEYTLVYPAIVPTSTAITGQYSSAIDTKGYHGALVIVNAGKNATGKTLAVTIGQPKTNAGGDISLSSQRMVSTNHTAITGASFTSISTSNDNTAFVGWLNLEKRKRYISVRFVRTGATNSSAVVVLTRKHILPTTQVNTVAFNL